jgi:hypothetical protein
MSSDDHYSIENALARRAVPQDTSPKHLKHLLASKSADRSACRLPIHPPSPSKFVERSSGGPVSLRVTVKNEPDRQLGPAQVGHAGIDEGVQKLEAKPGRSLAGLPPGGRRLAGAQFSISPSS